MGKQELCITAHESICYANCIEGELVAIMTGTIAQHDRFIDTITIPTLNDSIMSQDAAIDGYYVR